MKRNILIVSVLFSSLLGGLTALGGSAWIHAKEHAAVAVPQATTGDSSAQTTDTLYMGKASVDLTVAAAKVTPTVVHITASYQDRYTYQPSYPFDDLLKDFFGQGSREEPREKKEYVRPMVTSGSGVILTPDGYVITNNHVINRAEDIEVTLNDNRKYKAKLIGADPATDLALIKIEAKALPYIQWGNSDKLRVGEWVLAVGNPFNLTSTVTQGIVSAKARDINIIQAKDQMKIEAFIQTDAAVNAGNSGGALVNLRGELVGINTAIGGNRDAFVGYSFAIPSSIARKVADDLRKYGMVQRAILGILYAEVNADFAKEKGLSQYHGIYVMQVNKGSAGEGAGLKEGDVILAIDDHKVENGAQLKEQIAKSRPGDKIWLTIHRKGKQKKLLATLRNTLGDTELIQNKHKVELAGAIFENIDPATKQKLHLKGGVKVTQLKAGIWKESGMQLGFVITTIDRAVIENVEDLVRTLRNKKGGMLVEGVYPDGRQAYYGMGWGK